METHRFDDITRLISPLTARRRVLFGLALSPCAGLLANQFAGDAFAKKKKHKKRKKAKKPQPNDYGCLNVGQPCRGDSSACCSGVCEGTAPKKGKKDSSRCVAHDSRICTAETAICSTGINKLCSAAKACGCVLTTGNAGFCGDFSELSGPELCRSCSQDTDCQGEFGPGAACVVFGEICESYCPQTGGTACVPACNDTTM